MFAICRRTFIAAAVAAALIPLGANAAEKTYDADVVVIGAGASGTAAAWAAAEKGLKVVTLLSLTVPTRGNPCSAWGYAPFFIVPNLL